MIENKKLALVGFRLNKGGADRVMAILSNYFHKVGFDVHIIIFHDDIGYSYSGKLFNLGKLKSKRNTIFNKIKRFRQFHKYIKRESFDLIIDFRFRIHVIQELLISRIIYKPKTIYTVHSSRINGYMPNNTALTRIIYKNRHQLVAINNEIRDNIKRTHGLENVTTIYNPIDLDEIKKRTEEAINVDFDFILAVGEYDSGIKQFDLLIQAYSKTVLPARNIHLVILGSGRREETLLSIASEYQVADVVHLMGYQENPFKFMSKALYVTLTSKHEGFPMVLLESLACGTPVIAFDCPTGPSEIIEDKRNGLLIENQDKEALITGMNEFVSDTTLYESCKSSASKSVARFSIDAIGKEWLSLIHNFGS